MKGRPMELHAHHAHLRTGFEFFNNRHTYDFQWVAPEACAHADCLGRVEHPALRPRSPAMGSRDLGSIEYVQEPLSLSARVNRFARRARGLPVAPRQWRVAQYYPIDNVKPSEERRGLAAHLELLTLRHLAKAEGDVLLASSKAPELGRALQLKKRGIKPGTPLRVSEWINRIEAQLAAWAKA